MLRQSKKIRNKNRTEFKILPGIAGTTGIENVQTYMIWANYTSAYMPRMDSEYKLDYFMEDIEQNSFYYYFRQVFPSWLSSQQIGIPQELRGNLYYFVHKQLMARYYLERISNDLDDVQDFDWNRPIYPAYFSTLMYSNGASLPQRNKNSMIPYYKNKYLKVRF